MIPQLSFFQYNPIYQGAPIEETEKAYQLSANQFDNNLDKYNKLQTFAASVKALPNDKTYLDAKMAETGETLKSLSTGVQGTKRWDLANDVIQKMTTSYTQDPKLNAIRESYLNFQEGEKLKQAMRAKGDTPFEISDIRNHKSFDEEGNINIYQPIIQPKADYVAEADSIIKNIAPDVVAADLQPSEVEGILQGRTVKGFTREKLLSKLNDVEKVYKETDAGQQHKLFIQKNSPEENPDAFIKDFLFSIGSLRTFSEERKDRMVDPTYEITLRGRQRLEEIALRNQLKASKGNGNYDPSQEGLFSIQTLKGKGKVGEERKVGSGLMFANPLIGEKLGEATWTGDGTRVVQINKKEAQNKFDAEKHTIVKFQPKGYAMDDSEGDGTAGGMIGTGYYLDDKGKEVPIQMVLKNSDPEIVNAFSTYKSLSNVLSTQSKGDIESYKDKSVVDTSGLFDFTGKKIHLKVFSDNSISPVLETTDGKFEVPTDNVLKQLMLKRHYNMQDIQNMIISKIAPKVLPYTQTASQINK